MREGAPEKIDLSQIESELAERVQVDQEMRKKGIEDPDYWDEKVDLENTEALKKIVSAIGWPTISKVGERGENNAWLLVQHADHDVEFQKSCLNLMKQEVEGEVSKRHIAYLEDRVRVNESKPQLYGTQFRQQTGEHKPLEIEDPESVNERRTQMGLEPLEEGIKSMYERYGSPDQG
jgi:hypothetical protein